MISAEFQVRLWERQRRQGWQPRDYLVALVDELGRFADAVYLGGSADLQLRAVGAASVHLVGYCSSRGVVFWPLLRGGVRPATGPRASIPPGSIQNLEVVHLLREVGRLCRPDLSAAQVPDVVRQVAHTLRAIAQRRGVEYELLVPLAASRAH